MSGGGAGLMSCVREGSLEPPYRPPHSEPHNHGEGRTGRFLRGLRRMFKRRGSGARASSPDPKSSSTSELLDADRHARRKEGAYGSGLSVSHDSVFTGERSGDESSDERHHRPHVTTSHRVSSMSSDVTREGATAAAVGVARLGVHGRAVGRRVQRRATPPPARHHLAPGEFNVF
ncbi:hypothetical protein ABMA27_002983 [Loxostege sticticalis]|uniref:Uncharacterized protein n=1 Tax=Loxostege sticticalis TaxID=481309 RepID=A0ABR3HRM1_LOXSC